MEDHSEELLLEWKNRLGLQDWRILLCPKCSEEEMSIEDAAGATSWQETNKTARIEILDPADYGERVEPMDWEQVLVHELLHLKLCLLSDNGNDLMDRIVHILIDDLARAFVDAKRHHKHDVL